MARAIIKAKSDIFFRYLFGNPKNEVYLVDFINAVLQDCDTGSVDHITSAKVANPYNMSELSSIKQSILDIKATDDMRRTINIEMQLIGKDDYIKRSLYYWSKLYSDQLHEGQSYIHLYPVIGIHILDFTLDTLGENPHVSSHIYLDHDREICLTRDFELHYLQLPRLSDKPDYKQKINAWMDFFKNAQEGTDMTYLSDKVITEVKDIFDKFTATDEVHELYEAKLKADHDAASEREYMINEATRKGLKKGMKQGRKEGVKKGMKKGIEQGIAQGREQGREEGVKQGIAQGRKEGREEGVKQGREEGIAIGTKNAEQRIARELALAMKKDRYDVHDIARYTKLSVEEINKL